ncbi:hypothetical protein D3C79_865180 [compost metagenome]
MTDTTKQVRRIACQHLQQIPTIEHRTGWRKYAVIRTRGQQRIIGGTDQPMTKDHAYIRTGAQGICLLADTGVHQPVIVTEELDVSASGVFQAHQQV